MMFAQETNHESSLRIKGRQYYLASYPMFDINYSVYQCDAIWFTCKGNFHSGDILFTDPPAKLDYDDSSGLLTLSVDKEIFSYNIP